MRATGSTSAKRGPDDPADGLHPVFHVPLGAGHEQERLGVGRHLLPLPGTTCKTERTGLLQAPGRHGVPPPQGSLRPTPVGCHSLGCETAVSPKTIQQQLCFLVLYLHIFTPRISVFGALLGFCLSLLGYFSLLLKSSWGTIRKKHADLTAAQRSSDARGASVRILFNSTLHIFKPCYMSLCGFNMGSDITACSPIPENKA